MWIQKILGLLILKPSYPDLRSNWEYHFIFMDNEVLTKESKCRILTRDKIEHTDNLGHPPPVNKGKLFLEPIFLKQALYKMVKNTMELVSRAGITWCYQQRG